MTYLKQVFRYASSIGDAYPEAAVKFVGDVKYLLSLSDGLNQNEIDVLDRRLKQLATRLPTTDYSRALDALLAGDEALRSGNATEAETLCREIIKSGYLSGYHELQAHRLLVEALIQRGEWTQARSAFGKFRSHFGTALFHQEHDRRVRLQWRPFLRVQLPSQG